MPLLAPGGELMFYVYRRKAPIREFTDDYVRERIAGLSPDEAWEALRPLTRLGQALAELEIEVEVPEDVPLLGIGGPLRRAATDLLARGEAVLEPRADVRGEQPPQLRLVRPAVRASADRGRGAALVRRAGLEVTHFDDHEAGFTVRGSQTFASARSPPPPPPQTER